ncbi:FAD-dependent monooxygenase [Dyella flagellata]|uniref:2-polyprenyl-6-methoxyphenol hydroxylase n=1 Tax=Dyella flagellata TaxID=1867833 RepID=A0ABQ5XBE1_9GAMM|nr:FAD-dependent monooxygenase [Dyella flagellata]GLQ88403.1 2-polyprenyl-6-methoxyphenol hydroxylase [Dyella flagellata]
MRCDVLIAGAGPTGLVLALWLTKLGIGVHIIDKTSAPGTTSRALAVQARTLELYRQLDLDDAVVAGGHPVPAVNLWVKGARKAQVRFETLASDLTPFPFLHIFPQDQHERLLIDRLEQLGVSVQRQTELLRFTDEGDRVVAYLRDPDGREQVCEAHYLAGCDGARSRVRETLGQSFPGGTYKQVFYVADVDASGPSLDGQLHADLDEADFLAVFPLAGTGRARLIGTVRDERAEHAETLRFEDVSERAIKHLQVAVQRVNWFSTYRVHHRVAERFRHGRVFLLGDAAHIHSPAGGQGMNTGIGDAVNLAWKLAAVMTGQAPDALLDSYEAERIGFARRLVATTDRVFNFVTAEGRVANLVRTRLAPVLIPAVLHFEGAREFLFRTVSQITLNYRGCPLSEGSAGEVHGGDRLPWVAANGSDNFASLKAMTWQVHVYGEASPALREWCSRRNIPLHGFEWLPQHGAAGLERDALYLIRPDTYVALAKAGGNPGFVDVYFTDHGIKLRPACAIPTAH